MPSLERGAVVENDERAEDAAFWVPHDQEDEGRLGEGDADDEEDGGPCGCGALGFDEVSGYEWMYCTVGEGCICMQS